MVHSGPAVDQRRAGERGRGRVLIALAFSAGLLVLVSLAAASDVPVTAYATAVDHVARAGADREQPTVTAAPRDDQDDEPSAQDDGANDVLPAAASVVPPPSAAGGLALDHVQPARCDSHSTPSLRGPPRLRF
jgi:hypothetical protein